MNIININSIILGIVCSTCILSVNLCYLLLCKIFKIKVLEFSIFTSFKNTIHQDEIENVTYKLGWFPIGSHIKPLGKIQDNENNIEDSNLKFAYFSKPKYVKVLFALMPSIIYFTFLLLTVQFLSTEIFSIQNITEYLINSLKYLYDNDYDKMEFLKKTNEFIHNKNILVFEILIFLVFIFLLTPFEKIANWSSNFENKSILSKIFSWIVIATLVYFLYWKIPKFLLSFFSFTENLVFILNFLLSTFIFGTLYYFLVIMFLKSTKELNIEIEIIKMGNQKKLLQKEIFDNLNSLTSNHLLKSSSTDLLIQTTEYLKSDLENFEAKFLENEFRFQKEIKNYLQNKRVGIKRYLPFLITNSEKINTTLLYKIKDLFHKKNNSIKAFYERDILIVAEFLKYAKQRINTGEIFFYEPNYNDALWTKKEFPKNMFNYLSYQIRTNPKILTSNYIEDMKGYFSLIGLAMNDEEKTKKANNYYSETKDPFLFNIPEKYNDVRSDIQMAVVVMSGNERLLGQIAKDVIEKYGN